MMTRSEIDRIAQVKDMIRAPYAFPGAYRKVLITADGAIPQSAYGHNGAYIPVTGSSSAQLTLADPVAGEIGNVIRIHRIAGTGTHDVDFNDEDGNAVTVVLAATDIVVLQAVSTDGYRQIGA